MHTLSGDLERRLAEAESALEAIRSGSIDAVVVDGPSGLQIYTLEGADAFYRVLIEQMPEGAAAVQPDGTILYANETMADLLGVRPERLVGADLHTFAADADHRAALGELLGAGDEERAGDVQLSAGNRTLVDVRLSTRAVAPGAQATRCVLAVDLTQRKADEAAVRRAEERFRGAFDGAPIGMALLDPDGNVQRVNRALCALLGTPADELLGAPLPWLAEASVPDLLANGGVLEHEGVVRAGRSIPADIHLSAIRDGDDLRQVIAQVQDVSERREHEARLRHVADHDSLTGLLNRRAFEIALENLLARGRRYGEQGALVLLDIDHFKYINDSRGHQVGDAVLIDVAEKLRTRLRDSDVLARIGGDEFAVLLPLAGAESARRVAEGVVACVHEIELAELVGLRGLTVSAGVALVDPAATAGELLARADLAMYDAKDAGRDRFAVFDPAGVESGTAHRMTWLGRIRAALDADDLRLYAQPLVALADDTVVGHELLVRLPDAGQVAIPAGVWFEVAERYDLATAIDAWVLERALVLLGSRPGHLSVNISATSIGRGVVLDALRDGLARTGADAGRLTLEITETAAIGNIAAAARFAEAIRSLGCRLALDDFGAGFGSFYYLKHLPFDDVKIDGEFVRDSVADERDRAIIGAMVGVATSMGRRTVAECIEDAATLELMRGHGVDLAQGYHLGRPEPV